ncbi:2-trans-enoyl-CoA isomerase) (pECI) [Durusdinium trenchii]|uniref:2-trans-enoyl-CoA isomerase (PECI n=1 Tax=Durusdinium trenchii TaxID=1381693 RepID=A0ABP0LWB1_9DINO
MDAAAADDDVRAAILTGAGKYYCAGVDFAGGIAPMHPSKLREMIREENEKLFRTFIDFSKPLIVAANGPAIGAGVTSSFLSDAIVASEEATFLTPFKTLGLVPEGCSSFLFPRAFGEDMAKQLLEGKLLSAQEALEIGYCAHVVPSDQVQDKAQEVAEEWAGKTRKIVAEGLVDKLIEVNGRESIALANAMLDYPFLNHMVNFTYQKGKYAPMLIFALVRALRPLWSRL